MAERSLGERISLALQEQVYDLAAKINQSADEVINTIESVVKSFENEATPKHVVNVAAPVDTVSTYINEYFNLQTESAPPEAGGSDIVEPISLRDTLEVVYDYMYENNLLGDESWRTSSKDEVMRSYKIALSRRFAEHVRHETTGIKSTYKVDYEI